MYKFLLSVVFVASLSAELVGGVAVVVKGTPITLYEIEKEMQTSKVDLKRATDILIRKKLEELETKERKINVTTSEVYEEIKKTAARNNMSVSEFYDAIRESNGMTSTELKKSIKQRMLSQKLYSAIAYSQISQPSESEIEDYYKMHKGEFTHPNSFTVVIYNSKDRARLQEKIDNPMLYAPDIQTQEQALEYNKISPELAVLLEKTPLNSFTTIVPDGQGGYISFYLKEIESAKESGLEGVKNQIINIIMSQQREEVLGDYFARLRHNADIKTIRMPE